jgi:hypothetical protein
VPQANRPGAMKVAACGPARQARIREDWRFG